MQYLAITAVPGQPQAQIHYTETEPLKTVKQSLLVAFALTFIFCGISISLANQRRVSPELDVFDESAHLSYVLSLASGNIPHYGATLLPQARRTIDCESWFPAVPCNQPPAKPSKYKYQDNGYSYEVVQPPLGYIPYLLTASTNNNVVTALEQTRSGGFIWIYLSGLAVLLFAFLENLNLVTLAGILSLTLLNPIYTWAAGTVNNDSSGVFIAMICVLAIIAGRRYRRIAIPLSVLIGIVVGLSKGVFVVVPFALFSAVIIQNPPFGKKRTGLTQSLRLYLPAFLMLIFTFVGNSLWLEFQNLRAHLNPSVIAVPQGARQGLPSLSAVFHSLKDFFFLYSSYLGKFPVNIILEFIMLGTMLLIAYGRVLGKGSIQFFEPVEVIVDMNAGSLVLGLFCSVIATSIFMSFYSWVESGVSLVVPSRYFIALLPLMAIALASSSKRWFTALICISFPLVMALFQLTEVTSGTFWFTHF